MSLEISDKQTFWDAQTDGLTNS